MLYFYIHYLIPFHKDYKKENIFSKNTIAVDFYEAIRTRQGGQPTLLGIPLPDVIRIHGAGAIEGAISTWCSTVLCKDSTNCLKHILSHMIKRSDRNTC
jgi:hypothetical protein